MRLVMADQPLIRHSKCVAPTYEDGLALCATLSPHVLLVDLALRISQHNCSPVGVVEMRRLQAQCGVAMIALYSPSIAPEVALLLLHEGTVQALLDKDAISTHLSEAERAVLRGERYAYFQGQRHDVDSLLRGLATFELKPDQAYLLHLLAQKVCLDHIAERLSCSRSNVYLLLESLTITLRVPHYKHLVEAAARIGILSGGRVVSTTGVRQFYKSNTLVLPKLPTSALFLGHSHRVAV